MSARTLTSYLDENRISYTTITHSPAFTAQEVAQSAHVPGRELAKTVMVKLDGKIVEAVLPASHFVDLESLKFATGAESAELATEEEFDGCFPDCEVGAQPPCGNLYGMEVYVSPSLKRERQIIFNAGSHSELICMLYKDFEHLVHPTELPLSRSAA
ncbi:MAG TPA: YbaK/EbsC family protein [Pontiella sp.]